MKQFFLFFNSHEKMIFSSDAHRVDPAACANGAIEEKPSKILIAMERKKNSSLGYRISKFIVVQNAY